MGTSTPALDAVKLLVDLFDRDRKVFLSPDYKEEQLRAELLSPLFTALGWDVADAIDTIRPGKGRVSLLAHGLMAPGRTGCSRSPRDSRARA